MEKIEQTIVRAFVRLLLFHLAEIHHVNNRAQNVSFDRSAPGPWLEIFYFSAVESTLIVYFISAVAQCALNIKQSQSSETTDCFDVESPFQRKMSLNSSHKMKTTRRVHHLMLPAYARLPRSSTDVGMVIKICLYQRKYRISHILNVSWLCERDKCFMERTMRSLPRG